VDIGRNGAVVAAGEACFPQSGCDLVIAKYDSRGHLDPSFAGDGRVELRFGDREATANSVTFTKDGGVLVAGSTCRRAKDCDFALARLLPNGKPDPLFGSNGNGQVVTTFRSQSGDRISSEARSMAIDSRGRIVVGGAASSRLTVLARYKPRGHLVRTFGQDGRVVKDLPHLAGVQALALDAKDNVVAAGIDKTKPSARWALARFGKAGGLDSSFGNHGDVTTGFPSPRTVHAFGLAIDSQNRIIVTGRPFFSIARYQPNGNLNKSFGDRGRVTKDFGNGWATSVAIDAHRRPVIAGFAGHRLFAVARFLG
jgi:uncharacterized delta-60 repeat protein